MKNKTLYVSDLDGTLLDTSVRLSEVSRRILAELLADGLVFTVASARSVTSMRTILAGLPIKLPIIEFNGAFLSDFATGEHLLVHAIEPGVVTDIHARICSRGHAPFVSSYQGGRDWLFYDRIPNAGVQWYVDDRCVNNDPRLCPTAHTGAKLGGQVVCLTVIGEKAPLAELHEELREVARGHLEFHLLPHPYSEWFWLTMHDRRATKDQAIGSLKEMCGLQTHDVVVFGDQLNDLRMFKVAQRAIAVENADPAVRVAACQVIGPNHADSVALFIQEECRAHARYGLKA